jgi:hypothetical protein
MARLLYLFNACVVDVGAGDDGVVGKAMDNVRRVAVCADADADADAATNQIKPK